MTKIIGSPTITPMKIPDWNQTDPLKSDYIKNKPDISSIITNRIKGKANQSDVDLLFEESTQHYRSYEELNEKIGDIDSALDRIIAIQNSLLGVSE